MTDTTSYIQADFIEDVQKFVELERNSDYSKTALQKLWNTSIELRQKLEKSTFADDIPFEIWRMLGNVDLGSIKKSYRSWVLDEAIQALTLFQSESKSPS